MERVQFTLEFIFRASPAIIYKFLTTPSCLTRWFCDEVDITGKTFTFVWEGAEEIAEVIEDQEDQLIRFQWEESDNDDEYLEFKMERSPVTGETIFEITDYCDDDEVEDQKRLWQTQVARLQQATGG